MPPIPLVTVTPSRSGSTSGMPASAHASRAATMANCSQRSIRRACTRPTISTGSTAAGTVGAVVLPAPADSQPANVVTPGKSFVGDLDIDSLSMVEIAVAAQDKFGVGIPDDELKDLATVQDVVAYVAKNSGGSA